MPDTPTKTKPELHTGRSTGVTASIVLDMADTTWRMFVPTVGFLMLGRMLDSRYATKPWMMVAGIIVGTSVAAVLVKRQIDRAGTN